MNTPHPSKSIALQELEKRSASVDSILQELGVSVDSAGLLLIGSLAWGRGNESSDIDLMLLGHEHHVSGFKLRREKISEYVYYLENGVEVDTWNISSDKLTSWQNAMTTFCELIESPSSAEDIPVLDDFDIMLMNDLGAGIPIANEAEVADWRIRTCVSRLPDYVVFHGMSNFNIYFEDALAFHRKGDSTNSAWACRLAIDGLATAALGVSGEANIRPKWRLALLDAGKEVLGDELADGLIEASKTWIENDLKSGLDAAERLATQVVGQAMLHKSHLAPALMELSNRIKYDLQK